MKDELVLQFMEATGADVPVAMQLLEAAGWDLVNAVARFFSPPPSPKRRRTGGPAQAQEAEEPRDDHGSPRGIRAPMPQQMMRLANTPSPVRRSRARAARGPFEVDGLRDFRSEAEWRRMDPENGDLAFKLATLFRPPVELLFPGNSLEQCRQSAEQQSRWVLLNVQTPDFDSQRLNRDTWRDPQVAAVIRDHYLLMQMNLENEATRRVVSNYRMLDDMAGINGSVLPAVMVLDPMTGAKMKEWVGFVGAADMRVNLLAFAQTHSLDGPSPFSTSSSSNASSSKPPATAQEQQQQQQHQHQDAGAIQPSAVHLLSEEEQIKLALKMSTEEAKTRQEKIAQRLMYVVDDDDDDDDEQSGELDPNYVSSSGGEEEEEVEEEEEKTKPRPEEPKPPHDADTAIQFRMKGVVLSKHMFSADHDKIRDLYAHIEHIAQGAVVLVTPYPKKKLERTSDMSLKDAGLTNRTTLIVEEEE